MPFGLLFICGLLIPYWKNSFKTRFIFFYFWFIHILAASLNYGVLYLPLIIIYIAFTTKFNLISRIEMKKIFIFGVLQMMNYLFF